MFDNAEHKATGARNRHQLPHLGDERVKRPRDSRSRPNTQHSIDDIDDVDDEDDEDARAHVYRDERSRVALPTGSSLRESRRGGSRDEQDPFLAEDDLQGGQARSTMSASVSPQHHFRGPSSEAKARGWMAHVAESSSAASTASHTGERGRRQELPSDIYRDPDEEEEEEDRLAPRANKGKRATSSGGATARDRYSIYDDVDSSASTSVTTSDASEAEDDRRRKRLRAGRRVNRKAQISKAAGSIGSSLREPLLSSAGSEHLGKPPGAFQGQTSRIASADIYAYPHPPAKAGWTPWAPGNRVPLGEYKDKAALLLWFALVTGTLAVAVWMVVGAKVSGGS